MTLESDQYKFNLIEYLSKYCYENDLFDLITVMDIMQNGYQKNHFKIINTSTQLYYYMYNLKLSYIQPFKNGLITI